MSRRPPRLAFHLALVPPALLLLYGFSVPGFTPLVAAVGAAGLLAGAVLWGIWLVTYLVARGRGTASGSPWWLLAAPLGGLLVAGLLVADVPLRVRWAGSKAAFERAVRTAPPPLPPAETEPFAVPGRIGSYDIVLAYRAGEGVVFQEASGTFLDDAGFAYLPNGPFPGLGYGLLEAPRFQPLGDGWYAWTATW